MQNPLKIFNGTFYNGILGKDQEGIDIMDFHSDYPTTALVAKAAAAAYSFTEFLGRCTLRVYHLISSVLFYSCRDPCLALCSLVKGGGVCALAKISAQCLT